MAESEERPKLRGPLAPLRLFLSSGKAMGRAGKSLAGRGLQKVKGARQQAWAPGFCQCGPFCASAARRDQQRG